MGDFGIELVEHGLRWLHFVAGIVWIGHNYAGLVLVPEFKPYDPAQDQGEVLTSSYMGRQSREHFVFRASSVVAWLTGLAMLWRQDRLVETLTLSGYDAPLGIGVWIGTLMMLNVWLIMWPHQKKVLGFVPAPATERVRCSRVTFLCARTNTMLSIPLLFFMGVGAHAPSLFG
jgi:uncharacterized membrane protein